MGNENFFRLLFAAGETSLSFLYSNPSDLRKQLVDRFIKEVHTTAEKIDIIKGKKELFDNIKKKALEEGGFYDSIKKLANDNTCVIIWSIVFDWLIQKEQNKTIVFSNFDRNSFSSTDLFVYGKKTKTSAFNKFIDFFKRNENTIEETEEEKEMFLRDLFPLGRNYTKEEVDENPQDYLRVRINPFIDDQRKINQLKIMVESGFNPEIYQHIDAIDIYEDLGEDSIQIKKSRYGEPLEIYRKGSVVLIIEDDLDKCILVKKWVKDIDLNTIDVPLIFEKS